MILYTCKNCSGWTVNKTRFDSHFCNDSNSELERNVPSPGALKKDEGKFDATLISLEFIETLARVRSFGTIKYSRDDWKKGFKITRSLAAALRHIFTFLSGETNDPESGLSHLGHAAACLEHAIYDMKHHPENDDRRVL